MTAAAVRDVATRVRDAKELIRREVDAWVSSAMDNGRGYLVPLSYYWDGERMTIALNRRSPTALNLKRAGWARVGLGPTRDVVIVEGVVEFISLAGNDALADKHAVAAGFDARADGDAYVFLQIVPETIQAWRTAEELKGRVVMREGRWLA